MTERNGSFGASFLSKDSEALLIRIILTVWKCVLWILGIGNSLAGFTLCFGPPRFRAAPNYQVFEVLSLPERTYPVILAVGGLLVLASIFYRRLGFTLIAHLVSFFALSWWAVVSFGFLVDGQSVSGAGAFYVAQLAALHLCIVVAKVRSWFSLNGGTGG